MVIGAMLIACASSAPLQPSEKHSIAACVITCPDGFTTFRRQHMCRGGRRWFHDALIVAATPLAWIFRDGSIYNKTDVEIGSCDSVIRGIIQSRDLNERGQHPGENPDGTPAPPPH